MSVRQGGRLLACLLLSLLPSPLRGEDGRGYRRDLLEGHDFRADLDADGIPDGWRRVVLPPYKAYPDGVGLQEGGVRLRMNGRSAALETRIPVPVLPETCYRISGEFRTSPLRKGTAFLELNWEDASGKPLGTLRKPLGAASAWERFECLATDLPKGVRAASIRIGIEGREVDGEAAFRHIAMFRQPRLLLSGLPAVRIHAGDRVPDLRADFQGIDAGDYWMDLELRDLDGRGVWTRTHALPLPQGNGHFACELPLQEEGWFEIRATLRDREGILTGARDRFATVRPLPALPAGGTPGATGCLGLLVRPGRTNASLLAALIDALSPSALAVRFDSGASAPEDPRGEAPADVLLRKVGHRRMRYIGCLPEGRDAWKGILLRYWGEIGTWTLPFPAEAGGDLPGWKELQSWAATLPSPTEWGLLDSGGSTGLPVPAPFRFALGPGRSWHLASLPGEAGRASLRAFALEALLRFREGGGHFLQAEGEGGVLAEQGIRPEALALRTLSHVLRGGQDKGDAALDTGIDSRVIDRGGETVLLAWTRAPGERRTLRFPADRPVICLDLLGRTRILQPRDGEIELPMDDLPTAYLGVSPAWLATRCSIRLDGPIPAAASESLRTLLLENRFQEPLVGTLRVAAPPGWRVLPEIVRVSVAPGATFSTPLRFVPSGYETTGTEGVRPCEMGVDLVFAEGAQGRLSLLVPLRLEPGDLHSKISASRAPGEDRLFVIQQVTNRGASPIRCDAFLSSRGKAEERRPLGELAPGEFRDIRYAVPLEEVLACGTVVGVREIEGERRFSATELRAP